MRGKVPIYPSDAKKFKCPICEQELKNLKCEVCSISFSAQQTISEFNKIIPPYILLEPIIN